MLELQPVSSVSAPEELEDVTAVPSAPPPSPELEPYEPSGTGPRAPARMVPGLAEAEPAPESTILAFPPRLVAEQLTLMYAVSGAGSKLGWTFPVPWAAPDLLSRCALL